MYLHCNYPSPSYYLYLIYISIMHCFQNRENKIKHGESLNRSALNLAYPAAYLHGFCEMLP